MARNNPDAASEEALYEAAIDAGCNEDVTFERAIRRLRAMSETEVSRCLGRRRRAFRSYAVRAGEVQA